jgi:hypothetical protein
VQHESSFPRGERFATVDWRTPAIAVALAVSGWALSQVYDHSERLARLETSISHQNALLERIESKLDGLNR